MTMTSLVDGSCTGKIIQRVFKGGGNLRMTKLQLVLLVLLVTISTTSNNRT